MTHPDRWWVESLESFVQLRKFPYSHRTLKMRDKLFSSTSLIFVDCNSINSNSQNSSVKIVLTYFALPAPSSSKELEVRNIDNLWQKSLVH